MIDVVTKPGSQTFHGNLFEFFRNEATDARVSSRCPVCPQAVFRQNQYGGDFERPARKGDLFLCHLRRAALALVQFNASIWFRTRPFAVAISRRRVPHLRSADSECRMATAHRFRTMSSRPVSSIRRWRSISRSMSLCPTLRWPTDSITSIRRPIATTATTDRRASIVRGANETACSRAIPSTTNDRCWPGRSPRFPPPKIYERSKLRSDIRSRARRG